MVVARPVEPSSSDFQTFGCSAPVVPTKILTDPEELDRQLQQNGYASFYTYNDRGSSEEEIEEQQQQLDDHHQQQLQPHLELNQSVIETDTILTYTNNSTTNSLEVNVNKNNNNNNINSNDLSPISDSSSHIVITPPVALAQAAAADVELELEVTLPETERFTVELNKNECGLGITIAGYVCEREDLSGIFVKSLNEGSQAYRCGRINTNDRIVAVDGIELQGFTNYEAVEKLKQTSKTVLLTLERYLRGPKYEQLQEALAIQDHKDLSPPSPSQTTLSWIPIEATECEIEPEGESVLSVTSEIYDHQHPETKEIFIDENFEVNLADDLETATRKKWENIVGSDVAIVVANLTKLKGLGISLEGTVDVENGVELRPHHYIRSILPEGPVGQNGKLSSGDELLEVNGQKLLGIKHIEVVKILRELPNTVRLVCARKSDENRGVINTSQDREAFEARNILGGSLKNLLTQPEQRLLKALSDTSINTSSTVTVASEPSLQKAKSRSLEVTNLAMWSEEVEYVELVKTERGLGFSILDYQDPLDAKATVIVVRSLVPNGAAEHNGKITPGDRLISVDGKVIKNATLDQAVQALKGALPGTVRLGIAKPLPSSRASETVSSAGS